MKSQKWYEDRRMNATDYLLSKYDFVVKINIVDGIEFKELEVAEEEEEIDIRRKTKFYTFGARDENYIEVFLKQDCGNIIALVPFWVDISYFYSYIQA